MSKRILALAAVLALALTVFIFPTTSLAWEWRYSCCSNGKPLNVRSGPGKDYPVISKVPYGQQIGVDHDLGNGWSEVYVGSQNIGYCMTGLMTRTQPGPYVPPTPSDPTIIPEAGYNDLFNQARLVTPYTVTLYPTPNSGEAANVRWAPSKKATLLARYSAGAQVTVIAELGINWYQVMDPATGAVGFVNAAYVTR